MLAIDVGNSRVKAAVFRDGVAGPLAAWSHDEPPEWPDETPHRIVIGSVVPEVTERLVERFPTGWPMPFVPTPSDFDISLDVERPDAVGVDRVANAAAAIRRAGPDCVVVDAGTATTVDLVRGGVFRGGAILPGVQLMADSLTKRTALLPAIRMHERSHDNLPGRDTVEAIAAGVAAGHRGAVAEVVRQMAYGDVSLLVCGGAAPKVDLPVAEVVPTLTLEGLAAVR